jgi:arginine decarboxylase
MHPSLIPRQDAPEGARWTLAEALATYGIKAWGQGYFGVNEAGNLTVMPEKDPARAVDLLEVVEGLRERGYPTPLLIRFQDLLAHRLRDIKGAFDRARADHEYEGGYHCIYPIKVNQERSVCEEVARLAGELGFGLEAGSKPELLAVLGLTRGMEDTPIVCNGFKDEEFIETVILATKLGRHITTVVEKAGELDALLKYARRYDVRPRIGIRIKLASRGAGRWESSAGPRSKFGLFTSEALRAVEHLAAEGMVDCLDMLHCHIGSQVHDIMRLEDAVNELARVYCELHKLGAGLRGLDVGGGLGVDYDGSQTNWASSTNYRLDEYASVVVQRIKAACDEAEVPHPTILTESGRAMVAYSTLLVTNVLGRSSQDRQRPEVEAVIEAADAGQVDAPAPDTPAPLAELIELTGEIDNGRLRWAYHKAVAAHEQALSLFKHGMLDLRTRARCEELYWHVCRRLWNQAQALEEIPEELEPLGVELSDLYFCNFSLFQSMPDSWAIDQVFPVCPIHRLGEAPERQGILADITCDSDGQVSRFPDRSQQQEKRLLELHELEPDRPYYLGFFLVGAYQEILGDLHNLLGDTHAAHLRLDADGQWEVEDLVRGDQVADVLRYVNFAPEQLEESFRRDIESATRRGRMTVREGRALLQSWREGLSGYTYLEEAEPLVVPADPAEGP